MQHVLRSTSHLQYLHELQLKYVFVPADKAVYRWFLQELTTTSMYVLVGRDCMHVVLDHLDFMRYNRFKLEPSFQFTIILLAAKITEMSIWYKIHSST